MNKIIAFLIFFLFPGVAWSLNQDFTGAFIAAGFENVNGEWLSKCGKESRQEGKSYDPASIYQRVDLNGDKKPELIIMEGGLYCFGHTSYRSYLLEKKKDGQWKNVTNFDGIPKVLDTIGVEGWRDIMVVRPGVCFNVESYQEGTYKLNHMENHNGKPCDED